MLFQIKVECLLKAKQCCKVAFHMDGLYYIICIPSSRKKNIREGPLLI